LDADVVHGECNLLSDCLFQALDGRFTLSEGRRFLSRTEFGESDQARSAKGDGCVGIVFKTERQRDRDLRGTEKEWNTDDADETDLH
jgi:hypothetical protein